MPIAKNSSSPFVSQLPLHHGDDKKCSSKLNFFKKILSIKNTTIRFSTKEIKSHNGNLLYKSKTGYVENYKGGLLKKYEDALFIHGSKSRPGHVIYNGQRLNAFGLTAQIKKDYGLDIGSSNKPLHLASCYSSSGGEQSFAQGLANATGRIVKTYDNGDYIKVSSDKLKDAVVFDKDSKKIKPMNEFKPMK
ncbi:hypothetical protein [Serratia quinivorans]|uniref:hypothetical protein n=1 Tax=Serratia quinivorans TaxID=137545 RepID=UPI003981B476